MNFYVLPARPPGSPRCLGKITDSVTGDVVTCVMIFGHDDDCGRGFLRWSKQSKEWYSCREYRSAREIREMVSAWDDDLDPNPFRWKILLRRL
jgi:hypothetical protein